MHVHDETLTTTILDAGDVVDLVGPLGIGKSATVARLRHALPPGWTVVDDVDSPAAVASAAAAVLNRAPDQRFLLVSRRLCAASPTWTAVPPAVLRLRPWPAADIRTLACGLGVSTPAGLELVTRLAGGLPLLAELLSRSLLDGTTAAAPASVAASVSAEVVRRLEREDPDLPRGPLAALAAVGAADQEMLARLVPLADDVFDRLAALSVVRRDDIGITLAQPYRALLDLGLAWRRPLRRRALVTGALVHRGRQIEVLRDAPAISRVLDRALMAVDDPVIRQTLFPPTEPDVTIRTASRQDETAIHTLSRVWAEQGDADLRTTARLLDVWLADGAADFRLAVDRDDRVLGMFHVTPVADGSVSLVEPLLQQHTRGLVGTPDTASGLVLGMAISHHGREDVHALVLRGALRAGIEAGRLIVSTPSRSYQELCTRLRLDRLGETRHDVFRCGRVNAVFRRTLDAESGTRWVAALAAASGVPASVERDWPTDVRRALRNLDQPLALASSPLVALPAVGSADRLATLLRQLVESLSGASTHREAAAGQALTAHYLRGESHDAAARTVRMSRATYFRRLADGTGRIAEILRTMDWQADPRRSDRS